MQEIKEQVPKLLKPPTKPKVREILRISFVNEAVLNIKFYL